MNTDFFGPSAERNSWFGGLNAGVKCVVTVVLILAAILIKDPVSATVMLVLELVGFTVVGFRPVNLLARAWPILVAVASTGWSVAILVNKTGPVILDFGVNSITQGSLAAAVSMMLRSLAMVLPTFAFVLSTDPTDLGDSLAQTFRLPARFVLAALAALRLVGILFGEWNTLGQARRARGLGAGQGPWGRLRTGAGQMFALMVQAIRRGSRLAVTMEARGFGAGARSWAREPAYSRRDAYLVVASVVIVALAYGVSWWLGALQFLWG